MDSQTFLSELSAAIDEYGIDKKITDKYINSFIQYFGAIGEEEAVSYIAGCDSPKLIAKNIALQCGITSKRDTAEKADADEKNDSPEKITSDNPADDNYDNVTITAVNTENNTTDDNPEETIIMSSLDENDDKSDNYDIEATVNTIDTNEEPDENEIYSDFVKPIHRKAVNGILPDSAQLPDDYVDSPAVDFNALEAEENDITESENDESFTDDEEEKIPFTWRYLLICIASAPLILPLLGVIFVAFGIIFACFALGIVASVAVLIGIIIAGTGIALVGIIYGVTQIFSSLPIGLYEIGLGVAVGGIAMLSGILIYNFAIRLLPFVMKKLGEFMGFFTGKVGELYRYVKGMCAERV